MSEARRRGKSDRDKLGWGLFMIAMGVWFLLIQYDVLSRDAWHTWWPFAVIAMGVAGVAMARDPKSLGSGVTTIGIGCWLWAAVNHWYGLEWRTSWPLSLVAVGLGTLAEWAASVVSARHEKEDGHVG